MTPMKRMTIPQEKETQHRLKKGQKNQIRKRRKRRRSRKSTIQNVAKRKASLNGELNVVKKIRLKTKTKLLGP